MKNLLFAFIILISTSVYSQTGEKNFIDQNYIEVIGKAELEIIPDQIYLKIILSEKEFKNNKSILKIEKAMIDKLSEIGIDTKQNLAIKDFASNFQFYWLGKSDIFVIKEYQLLIYDAQMVGKVFVELEKIGISNISIDKLEHSKILEFRKEVKLDAIKAAKVKASELAKAIDQDIGRALYINEIENNIFSRSNTLSGKSEITMRASFNKAETYSDYNIEFEKIKIDYSILCRFELK